MFKRGVLYGIAACGIAVVAFLSCNKSSPTGSGGGQPYSQTETMTYTVSGSTIEVTNPLEISLYCEGSNLMADTSFPQTQSDDYVLSGNTLTVSMLDTLDTSQAVVKKNTNLTREGSGSGIQGTWQETSPTYQIVSGTPTAGELQDLNDEVASIQCQLSYTSNDLLISATQFVISTAYSTADDFIASWNGTCDPQFAESAGVAITVVKVNESTVQLTGRKSGEKVTITSDARGDLAYTSSNSANTAYTYDENPTTCPDDYAPAWYYTFVSANSTSTLAKAKSADVKRHAPGHGRCFWFHKK
jgi:hypothetical protein